MGITGFLYTLLIKPLELLFEIIISLSIRVLRGRQIGYSLIVLSMVINFLVLPLYNRADKMQEEENEKTRKLEKGVKHIKESFSGDERVMMLNTYYRQNDYSPFSALKGSLSLLLEIPFFIAAYNFLSKLELLQGASFGPIKDLGAPDALVTIGGFVVNVLPVLMTVINLISAFIYTRGAALKTKIQLVAMALFFLVFLYDSPSGLVFYWTLNNVFSLCKNIVLKFKNPKKFLVVLSTAVSAFSIILFKVIRPVETLKGNILMVGICFIFLLPLIITLLAPIFSKHKEQVTNEHDRTIFILAALFMFVLLGLLIPSSVISSSPLEFIDYNAVKNPNGYVFYTAIIAAGFFMVWISVFYYLTGDNYKRIFEYAAATLVMAAVVDYMLFGKNQSVLSTSLIFEIAPKNSLKAMLFNIVALAVVAAVVYLLFRYNKNILKVVLLAGLCAFTIMSVINIIQTNREYRSTNFENESSEDHTKKYISLSKNGTNVVVIMMDRAIGPYAPYIFQELPEVARQFEGFTYYPNSVSFGTSTNFGTPGLYGGYEYIPQEMNKRDSEPLVKKHNEALKVMPVIFNENKYHVTVIDPPYAGYSNIPDLTIYNDYPEINKYYLSGAFNNSAADKEKVLNRNMFMYSLYKVFPLVLQDLVYDMGNYNNVASAWGVSQIIQDMYHAKGQTSAFMDAYNELTNMINITEIENTSDNNFLMFCNDTTHEPNLLQLPDYVPSKDIDNSMFAYSKGQYVYNGIEMKMEDVQHVIHYQCNVASYKLLGQWFDYLRENGVWDNTRIILVSDHGRYLRQFDNLVSSDGNDYLHALCLLMVKDFNSNEYSVDDTLMTNADVPALAFENLVENPQNPFTGKKIESINKNDGLEIFFSTEYNVNTNNGNRFKPGPWFKVRDNVLDKNNWTYLGEY
ncbi:MAG: membrane protein insertase YidC [Erysipelotrichaceae bacterium]|nr:membrane protein insertase YidC [Erysipelotrichaceae bacterium]